jgi:hypothetical protein
MKSIRLKPRQKILSTLFALRLWKKLSTIITETFMLSFDSCAPSVTRGGIIISFGRVAIHTSAPCAKPSALRKQEKVLEASVVTTGVS